MGVVFPLRAKKNSGSYLGLESAGENAVECNHLCILPTPQLSNPKHMHRKSNPWGKQLYLPAFLALSLVLGVELDMQ